LIPITGIFCHNNYYKNNNGDGATTNKKPDLDSKDLLCVEELGIKKKSVTTHNLALNHQKHFRLGELIPSASKVDPLLLNPVIPIHRFHRLSRDFS
jgi:hypothetical protein